jgi:hypothetical protein
MILFEKEGESAVFLICTGFKTGPDPAFYLNGDLDPDPGSQTNADPCGSVSDPGKTLPLQKSLILT